MTRCFDCGRDNPHPQSRRDMGICGSSPPAWPMMCGAGKKAHIPCPGQERSKLHSGQMVEGLRVQKSTMGLGSKDL
jgi:hypothetical protein